MGDARPHTQVSTGDDRRGVRASSETKAYLACFIHRTSTGICPFPQNFHNDTATFFDCGSRRAPRSPKIQSWPVAGERMSSNKKSTAKVYQFPLPLEPAVGSDQKTVQPQPELPQNVLRTVQHRAEVVISGTFRRDPLGLRLAYEQLADLGFNILSPTSVAIESEADGFVYMEGETRFSPEDIESRHLDAIQQATLMWLHAPGGYVGVSGSLEVGFAHAIGVPIYSQSEIADPVLRSFVNVVPSPERLADLLQRGPDPIPRPPLQTFQKYYRRAAISRGFGSEGAKDTLVLMLEELGELARAIRKRSGIAQHGSSAVTDEGLELADVFIYVIHLANILNVDLGKIVQQKELVNLRKFEKTLPK